MQLADSTFGKVRDVFPINFLRTLGSVSLESMVWRLQWCSSQEVRKPFGDTLTSAYMCWVKRRRNMKKHYHMNVVCDTSTNGPIESMFTSSVSVVVRFPYAIIACQKNHRLHCWGKQTQLQVFGATTASQREKKTCKLVYWSVCLKWSMTTAHTDNKYEHAHDIHKVWKLFAPGTTAWADSIACSVFQVVFFCNRAWKLSGFEPALFNSLTFHHTYVSFINKTWSRQRATILKRCWFAWHFLLQPEYMHVLCPKYTYVLRPKYTNSRAAALGVGVGVCCAASNRKSSLLTVWKLAFNKRCINLAISPSGTQF